MKWLSRQYVPRTVTMPAGHNRISARVPGSRAAANRPRAGRAESSSDAVMRWRRDVRSRALRSAVHATKGSARLLELLIEVEYPARRAVRDWCRRLPNRRALWGWPIEGAVADSVVPLTRAISRARGSVGSTPCRLKGVRPKKHSPRDSASWCLRACRTVEACIRARPAPPAHCKRPSSCPSRRRSAWKQRQVDRAVQSGTAPNTAVFLW